MTISAWLAREVLPHERSVRQWLSRARATPEDAEEVVQEAYCRLLMLDNVDQIERPGAYFFAICRNLLLRRLKRQKLVSIIEIADIESSIDIASSSENAIANTLDYRRLMDLIETLPARCQAIVRLRKIEGWSQKEIAEHFGITEKAVEKQIWVGVKAIRESWKEGAHAAERNLRAIEAIRGAGS
jgi:RNA polymerase sigma factor (sigma-70 family)